MKNNKTLFDVPLSKVWLYQILDNDGENLGILGTTLNAIETSDLVDEWNEQLKEQLEDNYDPDTGVDGLAEFIAKKGFLADRLYIEDEFTRD